jgi:hypothetical protein
VIYTDPAEAFTDENGWRGARPKPIAELSPFERRCLRADAFSAALQRGDGPTELLPLFLAAFDSQHWPAVVRWLHR